MAKDNKNTKSFVLRIDAKTLEKLEEWAEDEFRSINGQVQWIIEEALKKVDGYDFLQKQILPSP